MTHWWQASDTELLAALAPRQRAMNAAHREMLELVAEITRRRAGTGAGYRSDAELIHLTCAISKTAARHRVDAATSALPGRGLTGEALTPELPATADAVAEDAVTGEHIATIRAVLATLPPHLDCHRENLEADLAGWAREFDPWTVRQLGRRAIEYLDPDGPAPRDDDPTTTRLSLTAQGAGYRVGGWLDREAHATLMSALSPLSGPVPAADGTPDPRPTTERHGAGLIELARRMLDTGTLPTEMGGQRPHLVVTVPVDALESGRGTALLDFGDGTLTGAIAAEDARRIACDAHRTFLYLDGATTLPLDIGRSSYVVPRHIRRALNQRDHGCAFPGCDTPPQWTDAHHVLHWGRRRHHRAAQPGPAVRQTPPDDPHQRVGRHDHRRVPAVPPTPLATGPTTVEPVAPARPPRPSTGHPTGPHTPHRPTRRARVAMNVLETRAPSSGGASRRELGLVQRPDESFLLADDDTVVTAHRAGPRTLRWVYLQVLREPALAG